MKMPNLPKGSWKTSTVGYALMVGALGLVFIGQNINMEQLEPFLILLTGYGLTMSRDDDKSSEDVGAASKEEE